MRRRSVAVISERLLAELEDSRASHRVRVFLLYLDIELRDGFRCSRKRDLPGGRGELPSPLKDGTNSVRVVVDEAGAVVATHDYDAFGNILAESVPTGGGGQPWPFEHRAFGELFDRDVGMVFLRARWMDPSDGRFVSRDPLEGISDEPMTLHRYGYAGLNPVNFQDPSGMLFQWLEGFFFKFLVSNLTKTVTLARRPSRITGTAPRANVKFELWVGGNRSAWSDGAIARQIQNANGVWNVPPDPRVVIRTTGSVRVLRGQGEEVLIGCRDPKFEQKYKNDPRCWRRLYKKVSQGTDPKNPKLLFVDKFKDLKGETNISGWTWGDGAVTGISLDGLGFPLVTPHEIGHTFGLPHVDIAGRLMARTRQAVGNVLTQDERDEALKKIKRVGW